MDRVIIVAVIVAAAVFSTVMAMIMAAVAVVVAAVAMVMAAVAVVVAAVAVVLAAVIKVGVVVRVSTMASTAAAELPEYYIGYQKCCDTLRYSPRRRLHCF